GSNEFFLTPVSQEQSAQLAAAIFNDAHAQLNDAERDYIWQMAGGHPGLTQAVAQTLLHLASGAPVVFQKQALTMVEQALENDRLVRTEVNKLWSQISDDEREALIALVNRGPDAVSPGMRRQLAQRGFVLDPSSPRLFSRLFTRYVQRQGLARQGM